MRYPPNRLLSPARSMLGALLMLHRYTLAQIDTTSAVVWDAARAFVIGVVFAWASISAPIQLLSYIMLCSLLIILIARIRGGAVEHYPIQTMGGEVRRMVVSLILVLMVKFATLTTGASPSVPVFTVGLFAWLEVGTALVYIEHMGVRLPPVIGQLARAMFKIRNDALERFLAGDKSGPPPPQVVQVVPLTGNGGSDGGSGSGDTKDAER